MVLRESYYLSMLTYPNKVVITITEIMCVLITQKYYINARLPGKVVGFLSLKASKFQV